MSRNFLSPEFRSLLRKEWSERRRLFLVGVGLMLLYLGYGIAYELEYRTRALVSSYYTTCLMFGCLAAVLLAMSTATGEYSRRTLRFSASLPVTLKQIAWARLLGAWACLAGPIVMGALLVTPLLLSGLFEQAERLPSFSEPGSLRLPDLPDRPGMSRLEAVGFLWTMAAIAMVSAMHLVSFISLLGTCCRSEATVGFLGAIAVLTFMVLVPIRLTLDASGFYLVSDWIGCLLPGSLVICSASVDLDGSSYSDPVLAPNLVVPLAVSLLITTAIGQWFARRYGCRVDPAVREAPSGRWRFVPSGPQIASRLGIRWPGRVAALAWLNARQSVPLCLAGLTIAVLITSIELNESRTQGMIAARMAGALPSNTRSVGLLWGAIVAVGIFSSELRSGLEHFWRSRPISPAAWFWTKFAVGLVALLGTLDLIPAMVSRASPSQPLTGRIGVAYAACIPLLHILVYALAVAAVCRLRRPIPAAISALVLFMAMDQIMTSIPVHPNLSTMNVYNQLESAEFDRRNPVATGRRPVDLTSEGYPIVYGIVAAVILGATIFARRTVVPPVVGQIGLGVIWLTCCTVPHASAVAPAEAAEIVQGIRARESSVRDLHVRCTVRNLRTRDFLRMAEANDTLARNRRQRTGFGPVLQQETVNLYEYYDRPPLRAWNEFDPAGEIRSASAFDGTVGWDYQNLPRRKTGTLAVLKAASPLPYVSPSSLLSELSGMSVSDAVGHADPDSFSRREVNGEQLIDFTARHTVTSIAEDSSAISLEHRYQVTVNASRNYWPIRMEVDVVQIPPGGYRIRQIITLQGWIEAGPIVYPKHVGLQSFSRPQDGSAELLLMMTSTCDVEFVEINSDIPDSIFRRPFPAGTIYHDPRDWRWYEVDANGASQKYVPKPRGIRGAVLVYHLLWIAAGCVYFRRQLAGRVTRPMSEAVST